MTITEILTLKLFINLGGKVCHFKLSRQKLKVDENNFMQVFMTILLKLFSFKKRRRRKIVMSS